MRAFRHARRDSDGGFTLVEVVVALVLLSLIMTALTTLFFRALRSSSGLQDRQSAVPVATQAIDLARSIPATRDVDGNSTLVEGRYETDVTDQWAAVAGLDGVDLSDTYATWDTDATSSSTPELPLSTMVLVSGQEFDVQTLVGVCYRASEDSDCVKLSGYSTPPATAPAGQVALYRVIVVVTFSTGGSECAAGCTYVASTLIDPSVDPTFNTNDITVPPPIAVGDSASFNAANPGVVTTIDVLGNDSGTFGSYPVVIAIPPTRGSVVASGSGIVTYTANNSASGTDYFTYYLRDATGRTSSYATVSIAINPRASADGFTTGRGRAVTFNLKTNDIGTYPTSGTTCVTVTSAPSNGTIALGTCGSITYTPTGSFTGTDSFQYKITDTSSLESNTVTATVTVYPPPTAVADTASTNANTAVTIPVQSNDTLPAGSATTSIITASPNGTATVSGGNVVFTPTANFSGNTSFEYRLTDAYTNTSSTVTVSVVVRPTAAALPARATGVGVSTTSATLFSTYAKGTFSGSYATATSAAGSTVTFNTGTGQLVYAPRAGYSGTDTVTYTVTDTSGRTASATWSVTVNAAPTAVNDSVTITGGSSGTASTTVNVTANDSVPGGIQSVSIVTGPSSGSAGVSGNNITYTSAVGFSGTVTLTYRVTDVYGNSGTASVSITVNRPAAPSGGSNSASVARNGNVTISVLANDTYPGGVASISIVTPPAAGTATVQGSGASSTIRYNAPSTTGTRTFTYRITDLYGQTSAPITVTVTVT